MLQDEKLLLEAFMNDCKTIIKINVKTNELLFLKDEKNLVEINKIYKLDEIINNKNVLKKIDPKDIYLVKAFFASKQLSEKCEAGKINTILEYRRRVGVENKWIRIILVCPKNYGTETDEVFLCTHEMLESEGLNREAFDILKERFHKVFFVNYSTNEYCILQSYILEGNLIEKKVDTVNDIPQIIVDAGIIHPDDVEYFLSNTASESIVNYFKAGNSSKIFYYRRKIANLFRWVKHEIFPTSVYDEKNMEFIHFIIDANTHVVRFLNEAAAYSFSKEYIKAEGEMTNEYLDNLLMTLNTFTEPFIDFFMIDVERNKYISYKIKSLIPENKQIGVYTEVVENYLNKKCSKVKELGVLIPFTSIEGLKEILSDKLTISREYVDDSGEKICAHFMKVEERRGVPTKVLCSLVKIEDERRLKTKTFGEFEVYDENGEPIKFSKKKSKQLLAYLIDKRGFVVSGREIARDILERDNYDSNTIKYVSALIRYGIKDLEKYGYSNVIIKEGKDVYVNTNMIDCDYYHILDGDSSYWIYYNNEYMKQYSWAEETNAEILHMFDR